MQCLRISAEDLLHVAWVTNTLSIYHKSSFFIMQILNGHPKVLNGQFLPDDLTFFTASARQKFAPIHFPFDLGKKATKAR